MDKTKIKIKGSFEYGKFFSEKSIIILSILVAALCVAVFCIIGMHDKFSKENFTIVFFFFLIMCISFAGFLIYIVVTNKYHKKKIEEWKQDAILTEGIVERLPGLLNDRRFSMTIIYKKGKKTIQSPSENKTIFPIRRTRYFDLLIGIKMPVLYSPKYNKVLFVETSCRDYVS